MLNFGIRIIFGKFGRGKGLTNTIIAINEMEDKSLYESSLLEIALLESTKNRNFTYPPQNHVVFSNYEIRHKNMTRYPFDPLKFMLPNKEFDFDIFPPFSSFHVEEAQTDFLSYDYQSMPKPALMAFARVRHPQFMFTLDLQSIENLNVNIRRYTFEYLTPLELEREYDCFGNLIKTISHCAVFYDYEKALKFEGSKDLELISEMRQYTHHGNIYACYDSHGKKEEFYDVDANKDFIYDLRTKKIKEQRECWDL